MLKHYEITLDDGKLVTVPAGSHVSKGNTFFYIDMARTETRN